MFIGQEGQKEDRMMRQRTTQEKRGKGKRKTKLKYRGRVRGLKQELS